jgi:G3E family GTPase
VIAQLPVYLFTGFLGSGKTSLLNGLLRQPAWADTGVVVNEFGDIGLDHLLVGSANDNIVLMDGGCLCCAVIDSLPETLADLYRRRQAGETPPFQRLVIETTGLADPRPIIRTLMRDAVVAYFYRLQGVTSVIDGLFGVRQLEGEAEAQAQAAVADQLVVTKTDLTGGLIAEDLRAKLWQLNPLAPIHLAINGGADFSSLLATSGATPWLGALNVGATPAHDHHTHNHEYAPGHDRDIGSQSFWIKPPVTWPGLAAFTNHLVSHYGRDLLRCKGLLAMEGAPGPIILHGVETVFDTQRRPDWPDADRRSRVVLIGRGLKRDQLEAALLLLNT